jgi:predicted RecA/RadA family phage recombinase
MAKNYVQEGRKMNVAVSAGVDSGEPVMIGNYIPAVALTDRDSVTGKASLDFGPAVYDLPVKGHTGVGNAAIAVGEAIFYDAALATFLNKNSTTGVFFGVALGAVESGATTTIPVLVRPVYVPAVGVTNAMLPDDGIKQTKFNRGFTYEEFESPAVCAKQAGGAASGTNGDVNVAALEDNVFEYFMIGTQTILGPSISADGLLCSLDLTNNDGVEYSQGITARSRAAFVIGTSPAFYLKVGLKVADVSGSDICAVGFRKTQAYQAAFADYTDKATLNKNSGDIYVTTALNNGEDSATDTQDKWADGESHVLEVYVSAAGVTTFKIDGAAPTATAAFTFDTGDVVVPFLHLLHDATTPGAVHLTHWECGLQ